MHALVKNLQNYRARKRAYFALAYDEIAASNLRFLQLASTAALALLLTLLPLASLLIRTWTPSPYHVAFVPAALALWVLCCFVAKRLPHRWTTPLCIGFEVVLYAFAIFLDTLSDPAAPSSFMQLVCIALSALFVLPDLISFGLLACAEAVYVALVVTVKDPVIAQYDLFETVAGLLFSVCVSLLVSSFRLNAHDLRMKFEHMSKRDALSNLYNKSAFMEQAAAYLAQVNPSASCSLAFIDLDDFKGLNDTLGHRMGDVVLEDMGSLLIEQFRPTDLLCRFGGDEFLALMDGFVDERALTKRFERISDRFREICRTHTGRPCSCSVGIVRARGATVDLARLIDQADTLLYHAKRDGKGRVCLGTYRGDAAQPATGSAHDAI